MSSLAVGLTGGIASGKSAVSQHFAELGVPVIDADLIARQLVLPGTDAHQLLLAHFGHDIQQQDGQLDRVRLRQLLIEQPSHRAYLNSVLHPRIRQQMGAMLAAQQAPYSLLVIPLLVETLPNPLLNRVLVVDCPEALQLIRLRTRDGHTGVDPEPLIALQAGRRQRLQQATEVILNDREPEALAWQVQQLHRHYLALSR